MECIIGERYVGSFWALNVINYLMTFLHYVYVVPEAAVEAPPLNNRGEVKAASKEILSPLHLLLYTLVTGEEDLITEDKTVTMSTTVESVLLALLLMKELILYITTRQRPGMHYDTYIVCIVCL